MGDVVLILAWGWIIAMLMLFVKAIYDENKRR
jgi:hypothetical protein